MKLRPEAFWKLSSANLKLFHRPPQVKTRDFGSGQGHPKFPTNLSFHKSQRLLDPRVWAPRHCGRRNLRNSYRPDGINPVFESWRSTEDFFSWVLSLFSRMNELSSILHLELGCCMRLGLLFDVSGSSCRVWSVENLRCFHQSWYYSVCQSVDFWLIALHGWYGQIASLSPFLHVAG
jgi:hypothetical protein